MSKNPNNQSVTLPPSLLWLADAPLFIDEKLVERFYDAVVQPQGEKMITTLQVTEEKVTKLNAELDIGANISPSALLTSLSHFLPFLKVDAHADAKAGVGHDASKGTSSTIELHAIKTPQRQLVNLALHYLLNQPNRLYLKGKLSDQAWRTQKFISGVPRALVFLDLPSQDEVNSNPGECTRVKLIPTAAEFTNGKVMLLYQELTSSDGQPSLTYPGDSVPFDELQSKRKKYWDWFDTNFDSTQATQVIENAAMEASGRLSWIDFRLPISSDGDTLHLHFSPAGAYDTGSFAYQLVKRGYKHGLRLVGTLKSEPDMNVLAVYEK